MGSWCSIWCKKSTARRKRTQKTGNTDFISYSVSENLGPFQSQHNANGLDVEQIFELGKSILNDLQVDNSIPQDLVYDSLTKLSDISKDFVKKAENVLHDLQIFKRDELVQEWISRLDRELAKNNAQYVTSASRWINVAFLGAGKASDMSSPIDFRIHIRLASGFRMLKDWENAKIQLELARLLSPRDMMVIRELGRCALELRHENEALKYLNEMKDLDHDIYDGDPEAFNLHIRILITKNDWPKAFELLKNVNSQLSGDTYIANMLAIAVMKVEGIESARKYFQRLRLLEEKQSGSSIWSIGNQINAALGLGEIDSAKILLEQLKKKPDASPNRESITRYFDEIIESQPKLDFKWKEYWP